MSTDENQRTEAPPITDKHRKDAKRVLEAYDDDRPTTTLPGTGGTVSGTVVNDWVDGEGNPIYGEDSGTTKDE